jgi:hypothetical protein
MQKSNPIRRICVLQICDVELEYEVFDPSSPFEHP